MKALWILLLTTVLLAYAQEKSNAPVVPPPLEQPPTRPGLEIVADFAILDLKSNMVHYSNNVVVTDPPSKPGDPLTVLKCRELTATRGADGRLGQIDMVGDVQMDQGDLHARGQLAVYTASNETVVLTGPWPPLNSDRPLLFSSQYTNDATEIIYKRLEGKMFWRDPRTFIPRSAMTGTNSFGQTNKLFSPLPGKSSPP
ncbi:MAG TPA: LptA/OstA family protein [Candidatus Acidoferrum sp.]|nr:LptA/OstA family protein [Candidatus Acidoferrum sp.]